MRTLRESIMDDEDEISKNIEFLVWQKIEDTMIDYGAKSRSMTESLHKKFVDKLYDYFVKDLNIAEPSDTIRIEAEYSMIIGTYCDVTIYNSKRTPYFRIRIMDIRANQGKIAHIVVNPDYKPSEAYIDDMLRYLHINLSKSSGKGWLRANDKFVGWMSK